VSNITNTVYVNPLFYER